MRTFIILLILCINFSAFGNSRYDGATAYGVSAGSWLKQYEDYGAESEERMLALLDFTHVYYSIVFSMGMAERKTSNEDAYFYCRDKIKATLGEEVDLFGSWLRLKSSTDKQMLSDPLPLAVTFYFQSFYSLADC